MICRVDDRFREEAQRFALRFTCQDCVHFCDDASAGALGSCSNGFPTDDHQKVELVVLQELVFCKLFELA